MTGGFASFIGDPSLNGWATFCVYLVTAGLCAHDGWKSAAQVDAGGRQVAQSQSRRRFWILLAVLLVLLGLTRQLDLQALAAEGARDLLHADGVYCERTELQVALVAAIGGFGTIGLVIALVRFRRAEGSVLAAMAGAVLLVLLTLIRTISLHDVDRLLRQGLGVPHAHVNNLFEIGALVIIAAAAFAFSRALREESEVARLRRLGIQERRRQLAEKRRASRS